MNIDGMIPTDGRVLILSARWLKGRILYATTEASVQYWEDERIDKVGGMLLACLRHSEQLVMERDTT